MGSIVGHDLEAIRVITVSNEGKRNACSTEMAHDLFAELQAADERPEIRAVVLVGAGNEAFCSGRDLDEFRRDPDSVHAPAVTRAFSFAREMITPVIGAVNGPAYAAGFILALSCDLRIADQSARFSGTGSRIGLLPIGGQLSYLPRIMPRAVVSELLMTSGAITAERAYEIGFVNAVVPKGEALPEAIRVAQLIAAQSPAVVGAVKYGLREASTMDQASGQQLEQRLAAAMGELPDQEIGVMAFHGKQEPSFPDITPDELRALIAGARHE